MSETETLIWDWNGTLLDDVDANVKVINKMLFFMPVDITIMIF